MDPHVQPLAAAMEELGDCEHACVQLVIDFAQSCSLGIPEVVDQVKELLEA